MWENNWIVLKKTPVASTGTAFTSTTTDVDIIAQAQVQIENQYHSLLYVSQIKDNCVAVNWKMNQS